MAVAATLYHDDGFVGLMLCLDEQREKVGDDPSIANYDPGDRLWFYWDADRLLNRDEYVFLGIEVNDIGLLRDEDLDAIDHLDLPLVDVPVAGMSDARISDVLRWARKTYPSRYSTATS